MEKIRFALIGTGWRADFFLRIAAALPELFEVTGLWGRDPEKSENLGARYHVPSFPRWEDMLKTEPEYVVTALARQPMYEMNCLLIRAGVPVLSETPPAPDTAGLNILWRLCKENNGKLQVAEQYCFEPMLDAMIQTVKSGLIGEVSNIRMSLCHGYHGVNMIRGLLQADMSRVNVWGKRYRFPLVETRNRGGDVENGSVVEKERDFAFLEFGDGKVALYDFGGVQYHSHIRTRGVQIQGTRGQITDETVLYLTESGVPAQAQFTRSDTGLGGDTHGYHHRCVMLGEKTLFSNPFGEARLNDDETAIARCMVSMGEYVRGGQPFYPLEDALQDTYLSFLIEQTMQTGRPAATQRQSWYK